MSIVILAISLVFGGIVFVKLIGSDAWLIKGLRGDKLGAVMALCSILLCGMLIFLLLRLSLSVIEDLSTGVSTAGAGDSSGQYGQRLQIWGVLVYLVSFCLPIITAYLLSVLYRVVYGAVRLLAVR